MEESHSSSSTLPLPNPLAVGDGCGEDITREIPAGKKYFSVGGIYRRKHTLRAVFRSASLVILLGGYALYPRRNDGGGGASDRATIRHRPQQEAGKRTLRSREGNDFTNVKNDGGTSPFEAMLFSEDADGDRSSQIGGGASPIRELNDVADAEPVSEEPEEEPDCPELRVVDPTWFCVWYALGTLYMFLALAIVCDEFFVPALEEMSGEHHLNLSMDVAGATLMAAGGSAPELFTSFVGTFQQSDIGIGTIVGSAVFNVLFVIGMCSILSKDVLTLTWWPLFRDCSYYALGLIVLSLLAGVLSKGEVTWWESLILLAMYFGYVALMYYNRKIYKKITGKELVLPGEDEGEAETGGTAENGVVVDMAGAQEAESTKPGHDDFKSSSLTEGTTIPPATPDKEAKNGVNAGGSKPPSDESWESSPTVAANTDIGVSVTHPLSKAVVTKDLCPSPTAVKKSDFRWPGTFRAGVLTMLLHPESFEQQAGIGIVAKIQGDVDHVFRQIDINGDGHIDKEELGKLFEMLGHEITEQHLGEVFASLDLDGNGEVSLSSSKFFVSNEN